MWGEEEKRSDIAYYHFSILKRIVGDVGRLAGGGMCL